MRLLHLRFRNLNSLQGDWSLDFEHGALATSGLFAITGDTGAGKTTILDAITLALFGKTPRNHDSEVMTHGATESMAEVEFEGLGGRYRAFWGQALKGRKTLKLKTERRLDIFENEQWEVLESGTANLKSTSKRKGSIEEVTGLNFEQFCKSVLLPQGDFAAFLQAKESERAAILERLTDSEIYSQLSIAAFERHKAEKYQLELLNERLKAYNLPSAEALKALKAERTALKKEAKEKNKLIHVLRENVLSLEKIEKLKNDIEILQQDVEKNKKEQAASLPDSTRLQQHKAAIPHQAGLKLLKNLSSERQSLRNEIDGLTLQLETATDQVKTLEKKAKEASAVHSALENKRSEFTERWKSMAVLDQELVFEAERIQLTNERFEQNLKEKTSLNDRLLELEENQYTTSQKLDRIETWEKKNPAAEHLKTDLKLLDVLKSTMRNLLIEERAVRENIKLFASDFEEKEKEFALFQSVFLEKSNNLKAVEAQLVSNITDLNLSENARESQRLLDENIKAENARNRSFETLLLANQNYRKKLKELSEIKEIQETVSSEDSILSMQIYANLDTLDALHSEMEKRQGLYQQQISLANYERDRANLKEGEACPLCGSLEHPFAAHIPDFLDTTKTDFEKAKVAYETLKTEQDALLQRQRELGAQLQQKWDTELSAIVDIVSEKIIKSLEEHESEIAVLLPVISDIGSASLTEQHILKLIASSKNKIEQLMRSKVLLEDLTDKKSILEKEELKANQHAQMIENELLALKNKNETDLEKIATCKKKFQEEEKNTKAILKKYGLDFSVDTFGDVYKALSNTQDIYLQNQTEKTELSKHSATIIGEVTNLKKQLISIEKNHSKIESELQKAKELYEQKKEIRTKQFGASSVEKEQELFSKELEKAIESVEYAKSKLNAGTQQLTALKSTQKEKEKRYINLSKQWTKDSAALNEKLANSIFKTVEELQTAFLSEEEATTLEQNLKQLDETEKRLKTQLEGAEKELTIETDKEQQYPILADGQRALEAITNVLEELQKNIGAADNQLQMIDELKAQHRTLMKKIEGQQTEEQRWGLMNSIIGAADGKRFRIFAQSLTLEQLINLANKHLQNLNSRYIIRKKQGESLDLEILDTYQADNIRSMNTLSGGEKFLTSLALALGLSNLAGQKTNIKSLFIDEGFGALDESALDMAISALENLQSTGVTIGIVSHIRGLKDRIDTQVQVHKKGNGISTLQVV